MIAQPLKSQPVKPDPFWEKRLKLAEVLDAQGIYPPAWAQAQRAPWRDQQGYRQTETYDADRHFVAAGQLYDRAHPALTPSRTQADESLKAYVGEQRLPLAATIPVHEVPLQHPVGQPYVPISKTDAEEKAKLLARQGVNHRTWHDGDALPSDLDQWIKTHGYKTSDIYQGPDDYHYRHNDVTRNEAPDVIALRLKHNGERKLQEIAEESDPAEPHIVRHIADDWLKEARREQLGLNAHGSHKLDSPPADRSAAELARKPHADSKAANDNRFQSKPEVLFFKAWGWGGSSLGHVAVNIDGTMYSWAPGGMTIEPTGAYLKRNSFRSALGFPMNVTPEESRALELFLKNYGRQNKYDKLTSNCTDPLEDGLESLGYSLNHDLVPEQFKSDLIFNKIADPRNYNYYPADPADKDKRPWWYPSAPWTVLDGQ